MPQNPNDLLRTTAATDIISVTKADTDFVPGACRALWVGTAGTANIRTAAGNIRTDVPLQQGLNPIMCLQVRVGGTASDIWAMY